jgi:tRNA A-37 threonylcarbamoyl transferase component Bud32
LAQSQKGLSRKLAGQILEFGTQIARSSPIKAAYVFGDFALGVTDGRAVVEVLLVIEGFPPKLMNYMKVLEGGSVVVIAVDLWVFERDVDRGFLGEALAWGLLFPYLPLKNEEFLYSQEVKLKKRLIVELLGNLVLALPDLSCELRLKPEYFMYETMLSRARLFPPMTSYVLNFVQGKDAGVVLSGYYEALRELNSEGSITSENGYVKMSNEFVESNRNPKTRLTYLSKTVPRALFSSILGVWSRLSAFPSQDRELWKKLRETTKNDAALAAELEDPERYVFVPTASGLVSLADRMGIEECARKLAGAESDEEVLVERIGGVLNDVYLVKTFVATEEKRIVVKRFKDWSSIKWFPLTLWSIGTRTFAVLALRRLERECSINQFLCSRGFSVPKLVHVSLAERLVFMEYVEGESARETIRRLASSKSADRARKELKILERIGRRLAKVHACGVTLGDAKPENVVIGRDSGIILTDFEQASRGGDKAWDIAEFLYYAGHDLPLLVESSTVELISRAFVSGYLEAGGDVEIVRKASQPKYTKVFSVFTLPHVVLAVSNVCRAVERK